MKYESVLENWEQELYLVSKERREKNHASDGWLMVDHYDMKDFIGGLLKAQRELFVADLEELADSDSWVVLAGLLEKWSSDG